MPRTFATMSLSGSVIVVYRAAVTGGTLATCHENDCVEWIEPAKIPWSELAFPSTEEALRDFLRSTSPLTDRPSRARRR